MFFPRQSGEAVHLSCNEYNAGKVFVAVFSEGGTVVATGKGRTASEALEALEAQIMTAPELVAREASGAKVKTVEGGEK